MDIYSKKKKWKFVLMGFAIIIGVSSLFVTNLLVKEIKHEERKKLELWADATKQLVGITADGNYSLAIKVISENDNIPVILVDDCDTILLSRNFQIYTKIDSFFFNLGIITPSEITPKFLRNELEKIKKNGEPPIEVNIIGDKQWIYYKDSALLNKLRFYPIYQLGFIVVFMFIAYFTFSSSRRSEQNQVWAGMAKETAHQLGTPISSLIAWIELLKAKDKKNEMFVEMEKDILRLETITNRFSKIGSKPSLKTLNLVTTIKESTHYLNSRFPDKIELKTSFEKKVISAAISDVLLHWVIENLCKNAVDAMKGRGEILITLKEEKKYVAINISDTGEGINKSIIKNIFKPGVTSKKEVGDLVCLFVKE